MSDVANNAAAAHSAFAYPLASPAMASFGFGMAASGSRGSGSDLAPDSPW